jgi:transposase
MDLKGVKSQLTSMLHGEMMSNQVVPIPPIPMETARSARATFSRNNFYIQTGERLKSILEDVEVPHLLESGVILPQITLFQFLEGLTDAQAMDAIRLRIDWKFALHLPAYPTVFHESALCQFRQRILVDPVCRQEFQELIDRLAGLNPPQADKIQDFRDLKLISMVCAINRLGMVSGAMSQAIEILVRRFPDWLRKIARPHWYGRYNQTAPSFDASASLNRHELSIQAIGADLEYLLEAAHASGCAEIYELPEIKRLEQVRSWQSRKPNMLSDAMGGLLTHDDCDFCIYPERIGSDDKYL